MDESYDPAEVYALLCALHLPALSRDQQYALAARAAGMPYAQIGKRLGMDERTARGLVEAVERTLAMGCGLPRRDPFVAGLWLARHAMCEHRCTAAAMKILAGKGDA